MINKNLLPLKIHFFLFWAAYSSILPFIMVVARQLGIPVATQGIITSVIIVTSMVFKPAISALADSLPAYRKSIFIGLLAAMMLGLGPIGMISPLIGPSNRTGLLVLRSESTTDPLNWIPGYQVPAGKNQSAVSFLTPDSGECYVSSAWDCIAVCPNGDPCPVAYISTIGVTLTHVPVGEKDIPEKYMSREQVSDVSSGHVLEGYMSNEEVEMDSVDKGIETKMKYVQTRPDMLVDQSVNGPLTIPSIPTPEDLLTRNVPLMNQSVLTPKDSLTINRPLTNPSVLIPDDSLTSNSNGPLANQSILTLEDSLTRNGSLTNPSAVTPHRTSKVIWTNWTIHTVEGLRLQTIEPLNIRMECAGGEWSGSECQPPWTMALFWLYLVLLMLGQLCSTTVESMTDAVCCDTIGDTGSYGQQRVWGTMSYGLAGVVSGVLVDWMSGTSRTKNYSPAFIITIVCGLLDLLLSTIYLTVPRLSDGTKLWRGLKPLLKDYHFLVFLGLSSLLGLYDGLDTGYVFVLQEDTAGTKAVAQHMKLIQGLTMMVQAVSSIPFMLLCDWFMKKMGSQKVLSMVLFLYSIRLLGLALASTHGQVWATVVIELVNGPCFGLGFTAVVVHAASLTPRGLSTTIQGVVSLCYGTIGYAGASFLGGLVYEAWGAQDLYLGTGIMAAISFILHLIYIRFCPPGRKVWDEELDDATVECTMKLQHSPTTAATTAATETMAATVAITEATETPAVAARPATTALRTAATETAVATQATAAEFNPLLGEQRSGQRELDKYIC